MMFINFMLYSASCKLIGFSDLLENEDAPTFVDLNYAQESNNSILYMSDINFDTAPSNTRRNSTYVLCTIYIEESTQFSNNYAFGSGKSSGQGGAIMISNSILCISNYNSNSFVTFTGNSASVGGAICAISSASLSYNTIFQSNIAYKFGGAFYFQGAYSSVDGYLASQVTLLGSGLNFTNNTAFDMGGAIAATLTLEIYFENTIFVENKCSLSGGAVICFNCDDLKFVGCAFICNTVDATNPDNHMVTYIRKLSAFGNEEISSDFPNTDIPTRFKGRGGGAISFLSNAKKGSLLTGDNTYEKRTVNTQHCCFINDSATTTGQSFGQGAGHEILLEGYSQWISYYDYVSGFKNEEYIEGQKSEYVSRVLRGWASNSTGWQVYNLITSTSDSEICSLVSDIDVTVPTFSPEQSYSYASEINTGNGATSSVPSPTTFVYAATPITKLPYQTTASAPFTITAYTVIGSGAIDYSKEFTNYYPFGESFTSFPFLPDRTIRATPAMTLTASATPSKTPLRTDLPTPNSLLTSESGKTYSTFTSQVIIATSTFTTLKIGDQYYSNSTWVVATTNEETNVYTVTVINTEILTNETNLIESSSGVVINSQDSTKSTKKNMFIYIGIAAAVLLSLLAIIIVIEMNEETVLSVPDTSTNVLMNDNPLWTTSVLGDTDDPFKEDFEENHFEGIMRIAHDIE